MMGFWYGYFFKRKCKPEPSKKYIEPGGCSFSEEDPS